MRMSDSDAWRALDRHARDGAGTTLAAMFDAESDRLARMALDVDGLHFDFSKMRADAKALTLLEALAEAADLAGWRARLFAAAVVNPTESRAATHAAERGSGAPEAVAVAAETHGAMQRLVAAVRGGQYGVVRHVLHIGIGGSALGPALLLDALGDGDMDVEVVSNIDGVALERACAHLDPMATLVVIVSKSFTSIETMANAASAIDWLREGGVADPMVRCVAVTAETDRARAYGIAHERILGFPESVGGRTSLWSAVGVTLALSRGWGAFDALLKGAAAMDRHFIEAPAARNAPVLAAMLDVWHASFLRDATRAIFAYDERLRLLPPYLQQLEMESNGKQVTRDGELVDYLTAPVSWGGVGTDAQHAVFQLLHQGTQRVPVEFVAVIEPGHNLGAEHHRQLLTNCFAQGAALMCGRTLEEARALTGDPALATAKMFPGDRPSATILLDRLDAYSLGALLAFYEHRTFAASCLLGINAFDQMGVELGKAIAQAMRVGGGDTAKFDASTTDLLRRALGS